MKNDEEFVTLQNGVEKKLIALENGVEEVKSMQAELSEKNDRLQFLIEQMERQLNQYERSMDSEQQTKVNNGELLSVHGIMKQPTQRVTPEPQSLTIPTP